MENKGEFKIKFGTVLSVVIIIALLIVGGVVIYQNNTRINDLEAELSKQKIINTQKNEEIQNTKSAIVEQEKKEPEFILPSLITAKAKNVNTNVNYEFYVEDNFFYINIKDGVPYIRTKNDNVANYSGVAASEIKLNNQETKINGFTKKVADVNIGCMGQSYAGTFFIFIMEDGSVEYSKVDNMLKNISTQGKINGLSNIVKIQNVSVYDVAGGGAVSIIAIDNENNYYDLNKLL